MKDVNLSPRSELSTSKARKMAEFVAALVFVFWFFHTDSLGVAAEALTFTVEAKGAQEVKITDGSVTHTITINFSGTLHLKPSRLSCDEHRFSSEMADLHGSAHVWGEAVAQAPAGTLTNAFDKTSLVSRRSSHTISKFTPETAADLYFITRDTIYAPPDEVTIYAFEYISNLGILRVWVSLPEPFSYDAKFEHYDFEARHSVSGLSEVKSCLHGVVINAKSGNPVSGARVTLGREDRVTGADGKFEFSDLDAGTHDLEVVASGYAPVVHQVEVTAFQILERLVQIACCGDSFRNFKTQEIEFGNGWLPPWRGKHKASKTYVSEARESLQVWWSDGESRNVGHFELRYYAAGETVSATAGILIGSCAFVHGANISSFTFRDSNANGEPDCFVSTIWRNFDLGDDDTFNPKFCVGKMDIYVWLFSPPTGRRVIVHECREYLCEPPISRTASFDTIYDRCRNPWAWGEVVGKPLVELDCPLRGCVGCAPQATPVSLTHAPGDTQYSVAATRTEGESIEAEFQRDLALFYAAGNGLGRTVMGAIEGDPFDLNFDGRVDAADIREMIAARGRRFDQQGYLAEVDVDADLDVDLNDLVRILREDSDNDGMPDGEEIAAGTDPFAADSNLRITGIRRLPNGTTALTWQGVPGHRYMLFHSSFPTMLDAVVIGDVLATKSENTFMDTSSSNQRASFYRVGVAMGSD